MPRLNDAELLQPHLESAALPALPAELLAHFQLRHRVWKADVGALARDAAGATADPTAAHVAAVARVLDGDDAAIADAVGAAGWHAKLLAKLLYAQPTLFRWQAALRDRELARSTATERPGAPTRLADARGDPGAHLGMYLAAGAPACV